MGPELGLLHAQDGRSDGSRIQRVGLAQPPAAGGVHTWRFGDIVACIDYGPGQTCPVSADTLDCPQTPLIAACPSACPGKGAGNPCRGGRELLARELSLGAGLYDGERVGAGVAVHADDERAGLRNDSQRCHPPSFGTDKERAA